MTSTDTTLPERLRVARQSAGVTQQQAATALGVSRPLLVAMEKGSRKVRPEELVTLASLYRREVSDLLRPQPPVEGIGAQFRLALPSRVDEEKLHDAIAEIERLADDFLDLARRSRVDLPRRYPTEFRLTESDLAPAAEDLALEERRRLGLGDGPVQQLREFLEDEVGLRIFMPRLPSKIAGAIVYAEPLGGCVAVNANHPVQRRRWTLAHEYAHFLTRRDRSEVTTLGGRSNADERFADLFAADFLMPRSGVRRRFLELTRDRERGKPTVADLFHLARAFRVSFQAMTHRLEDLALIPSGTFDKLEPRLRPAEAERTLGLSPDHESAELLPVRYRFLAVELFTNGEITEGQLSAYLRTDRAQARDVVRELTTSNDVTGGGMPKPVRWNEPEC
ncbi:helix-turn-helix domain-containing protein [Actinomadura rupiterrae]|uniref:helix-turn-helix domain-containing protein n=1 Tax=Actinomadura rupiterrae TaxID=559627 RepID=UPI0020A380C8|nr:XRE family transcriptional regulator [Actinomadura rupiterrae]MCP2335247.1 Zn-dependent peptidase ImmA (M78 family)/DNA-binding XRE family transcriptional regulator [Actinomadura rupiterrae]